MKYKMLNELLEVAMAFQPQSTNEITTLDALEARLKEGYQHKELTSKQRRVLNCVSKVCEVKRKPAKNRQADICVANSGINV
jgi:hypothetical protein